MKKLLIAIAFLSSAPSFALVREVALCTTHDQRFTIAVMDNQGIGPVRASRLFATVTDSKDEVVAAYKVEEKQGGSISFGRDQIVDSSTNGQQFNLAGPSTNVRAFGLVFKVQNGQFAGRIFTDSNLSCSVFGGALLQQPQRR